MLVHVYQGLNHLCLGVWIKDGQKRMLGPEAIPYTKETVSQSSQNYASKTQCPRLPVKRIKVRPALVPVWILASIVLRRNHVAIGTTQETDQQVLVCSARLD